MMKEALWGEYDALRRAWEICSERKMLHPGDDAAAAAEQLTWDALIAFVEAHELTDTDLDPRGQVEQA